MLRIGFWDDLAELEHDPQEVDWLLGDSVEKDRLIDLLVRKDQLTDLLGRGMTT